MFVNSNRWAWPEIFLKLLRKLPDCLDTEEVVIVCFSHFHISWDKLRYVSHSNTINFTLFIIKIFKGDGLSGYSHI